MNQHTGESSRFALSATLEGYTLIERMSGAMSYLDYVTDGLALSSPFPTYCVATGNNTSDYVTGKGFNHISVGRDSGGTASTAGVYGTSTYKNPSSGQELPHVTAPVPASMTILDGVPAINGGTSTASALTAGVAASAMSACTTLKYCPEGVRALLMASADAVDGNPFPNPSWPVDAKAGCGRPNGEWIHKIAHAPSGSPWQVQNGFVYVADIDSADTISSGALGLEYGIQQNYTRKARVVLSWISDPDSGLEDLDLTVIRQSDGVTIATSWGSSDPVHVIDFGRLPAGLYTVRITAPSGLLLSGVNFGLAISAKPL